MTDPQPPGSRPPGSRPGLVTVHPSSAQAKPAGAGAGTAKTADPKADPKAQARARLKEKTNAKNAMVASLGALVFTGYLCAQGSRRDNTTARVAHMAAGVALLGASYWHTTLYGPRNGGTTGR